ncbi:acyl-CoA dehydrogenase family protein [Bosea sp. ASV33]|uniref:acyl-CoA dehydrogenase family protein n=1 Tax=Bosea sp. ASV33 TaxID=2795106 RepID=UPI0018EAECF4|nr:acyl-CoA dehydrogenase family protein [Bosea sp. ASV33]
MALDEERLENVRMLRESAAAVADRSDLSRVRAQRFRQPGFDRAVWRQMGELGWLGLRLPEERGGAGLGMAELIALTEELGAALAPEPFISALMATDMLDGARLEAALTGEAVILAAWQEKPRQLDGEVETSFVDGRVSGRKLQVPMALGADAFAVTTPQGVAIVDAGDPGLSIEITPAQDGGHWGTLTFNGARGEPGRAPRESWLDEAVLATAATLLGIIDATLERTVDYLNVRQQFGVKIGTFQALQHRAVDLKQQALLTRASIEDAAAIMDEGQGPAAKAASSRAKARASDAALIVTRQAIQLHGGIGYTDEHDIGLFLRKAMVLAPSLGDSALHRRRFAQFQTQADAKEGLPA